MNESDDKRPNNRSILVVTELDLVETDGICAGTSLLEALRCFLQNAATINQQ